MSPIASDIDAIAREFALFRGRRGHFAGGDWDEEVDAFNGRKHQVMEKMRIAIPENRLTLTQVVAKFGETDILLESDSPILGIIRRTDPSYAATVATTAPLRAYSWRGQRDFLYLYAGEAGPAVVAWFYLGE
eukprot:Opistho-2@66952